MKSRKINKSIDHCRHFVVLFYQISHKVKVEHQVEVRRILSKDDPDLQELKSNIVSIDGWTGDLDVLTSFYIISQLFFT